MESSFNKNHASNVLLVILLFLTLLVLFFPLGAYFFSFCVLVSIANSNKKIPSLFVIISLFLFFSIIVNENSVQKFIFINDDFTTYYNNYLDLLHNNFDAIFAFGGGMEIGLPVVNLLLSLIISDPVPYILQCFYIVIFFILLIYYVHIDTIFGFPASKNKYMLFLWAVLFMKITAMLTIERQAISSFFVLYAIADNRRKFLWIIIGSLFHLTTPIVFLMVKYILETKNYRRAFLASGALFLFVIFSFQILSMLMSIFPNDKIGYILYFIHDKDFIRNEFIKSFKQVVYIIPLLLVDLFFKLKGVKWQFGPSLWLFAISMLVLAPLPGLPTRLMMPIVYILFGFYYYSLFSLFHKRSVCLVFILIAFFMTSYKFMLPGYYYRFPAIDFIPGYYVGSFFEEYPYIQRSSLSSDENIENENKL